MTQVSIVVIMAVMNNVLVIYGAGSKYGADIPMTVVGIVMKDVYKRQGKGTLGGEKRCRE